MTGRPSTYTPEIAEAICNALREGRSLRAWCKEEGNPCYSTVFKWLEQQEGFADSYARAREVQAHNDADRINAVAEQLELGAMAPDVARVIVQAMQWTAARRLPKAYGDKLSVGGEADGAPLVVSWITPKDATAK